MTTPSHFDTAAQTWDQRPMSLQLAQVSAHLLEVLPLDSSQHWLDFGAGTGMLATALAAHVGRVTALDTSANMLQVLRDKGFANVDTLCADVFDGLPQSYDGVVSCMALHHVADTAGLLQVFFAHLHPGGRIALVDLVQEDGSFHGDNEAKGVKHFGFAPDALTTLAQQAGFVHVTLATVVQVRNRNGRDYPLFLLQGEKPAA